MFDINTKYGIVKVYAETIEQEAVGQITQMANSPLGENSHIRIMPDAHAGAGCTIGTTMQITNKVCPNLVGVDIGCGVQLAHLDINVEDNLDKLDKIIRQYIPTGMTAHKEIQDYNRFSEMRCWDKLDTRARQLAQYSLGTLGGGNHFIEGYAGGFISVHSGSRNIGLQVAKYYQLIAVKRNKEARENFIKRVLPTIAPEQREEYIKEYNSLGIDASLTWLEGSDMEDYLHDVAIMQDFAKENRAKILSDIANKLGVEIYKSTESIHNYIDVDTRILRKGAISAREGEELVIPLNMRDGLLVCIGKGNSDWNYSAPHGAGRLYSRSKAKRIFTVEEYQESMQDVYTTCVNQSTLDEAPFVYKDYQEIERAIEPTVTILERLIPIYNYKAN